MDLNEYQTLAGRTAAREPVAIEIMGKLIDGDQLYRNIRHLMLVENQPVAGLNSTVIGATVKAVLLQLAPHWSTLIGALGLAGEAGEYAELIKKAYGHGHKLDPDKALKELGDVLWYTADSARLQGIDLEVIGSTNIEKLKTRYPDQFTTANSTARVDVQPDP